MKLDVEYTGSWFSISVYVLKFHLEIKNNPIAHTEEKTLAQNHFHYQYGLTPACKAEVDRGIAGDRSDIKDTSPGSC